MLAAFLWWSKPAVDAILRGLPLSLAGLGLRAWAAGNLAKNQALATGGPYASVRNPLYLGSLLLAGGLVIGARDWPLAALFAAVFLLIYLPVIELEEQHLRELFPAYADYERRVPGLWPRPRFSSGPGSFEIKLYVKNQEYQALAAYLGALAWMLWKAPA